MWGWPRVSARRLAYVVFPEQLEPITTTLSRSKLIGLPLPLWTSCANDGGVEPLPLPVRLLIPIGILIRLRLSFQGDFKSFERCVVEMIFLIESALDFTLAQDSVEFVESS